jgi:hypothetical protein
MCDDDDDPPIRGEVRLAGHRRVSHGLFVRLRADLTTDQEFVRDLRAYQLVLPASAVFTHVTGARLRGWRLPRLPEQVPVFAAVEGDVSRPRRSGLICSRLVRKTPAVDGHDLPVEAPEEILLRAARDLGLLDLTIMVDSARALGDLDEEQMRLVLASRRPGVRMLRAAYELSITRAESAGETILRVFHEAMDLPTQPQVELYDDLGRLVGRADLLVTGTTLVHEYDGEHHRSAAQHRVDLRRDRGLRGTAYQRRGFVLDDLLNHPLAVMHEIDRALGRPHRLSRLGRWRRLVDNSLYSEAGRERVMNRWRRQDGLVDWSRTA